MKNRVKISAIIHTYNEDTHLQECLKSVRWCDEVLVIDLGSKDRSIEIAGAFADKVLYHGWVPVVEQVKEWSYSQASHDWLLVLDPDEIYPDGIEQSIRKKISEVADKAALIRIPMQYYFRKKPLKCCMWYPHMRRAVIHRKKHSIAGEVHEGGKLAGDVFDIKWGTIEPIKHFWNDSWRSFLQSHWRYIKREGSARYYLGKRFGLALMAKAAWKMFRLNLIDKNGYQGGVDGILLSFAMGLYETGAHLSLLKYQWNLKRNKLKVKSEE